MRKHLMILAGILASLALVAVGCGGDDNNDSGSSGSDSSGSQSKSADTTESGSTGGGGGAQKLTLTADPGGALKFDKKELSAKAGKVTITMDNPSSVPHAVEVEGNGVEKETKTLDPGQGIADGGPQVRQVRVLLPGRRPQAGRHGGHPYRRLSPRGSTSTAATGAGPSARGRPSAPRGSST